MTTLRKITLKDVKEAKEHLNAYQVTIKDVNKENYEGLQPAVDQISALLSMIPAEDASSEAKEPANNDFLDAVVKTRHTIQTAVLQHGLKTLPDNFATSSEAEISQPFFTVFINKLIEQESILKIYPQVEQLDAEIARLTVAKSEADAKASDVNKQLIELKANFEKEVEAHKALQDKETEMKEELGKLRERVAAIDAEENIAAVVDLSVEVTRATPRPVLFAKYQALQDEYKIATESLKRLKAEKIEVADTIAPADVENNPHYRDAMLEEKRKANEERRRSIGLEKDKNDLHAQNATLLHDIEELKKQLAALQQEQEEKFNQALVIKMAEHNIALENAKKANIDKDLEIAALIAKPVVELNEAKFVVPAELGTPKKKGIAVVDGEGLMGVENSPLIPSSSAPASAASSSMLPSRGWIGWMLVTFADLVLTSVSILSYVGLTALMASNPFTLGVGIGAGFTALFLGKKTYDEYQANKPVVVTQVAIEAVDEKVKSSAAPTENDKVQDVDPSNVFVLDGDASKENNVSEDNNNANDASGQQEKEISVASETEISSNKDSSSDAPNDANAEHSVSSKKDETDPTAEQQVEGGENVHSIAAHLKAKSDADNVPETAKETLEGTNEGQTEGTAPRKDSKEGIDVVVVPARKLSKELLLGDVTGMAALIGNRKDAPINKGKTKADAEAVAAANLLKTNSADNGNNKKGNCSVM